MITFIDDVNLNRESRIMIIFIDDVNLNRDSHALYIYIFIHQYGSAQKENTNIQTKSSIKNTLTTHNVHSQSSTIFTKCIDRIFVFTNKFLPSFFNI